MFQLHHPLLPQLSTVACGDFFFFGHGTAVSRDGAFKCPNARHGVRDPPALHGYIRVPAAVCSVVNKPVCLLYKLRSVCFPPRDRMHSSLTPSLYTLFILSCSSFEPLRLTAWTSPSVWPTEVSSTAGRRLHTTCFTFWPCMCFPCLSWRFATLASSPRSMRRCSREKVCDECLIFLFLNPPRASRQLMVGNKVL